MLNMGHFILWAHCAYLGEHRRIVVRALRVGIILALVIVLVLSALLFAFVGDGGFMGRGIPIGGSLRNRSAGRRSCP